MCIGRIRDKQTGLTWLRDVGRLTETYSGWKQAARSRYILVHTGIELLPLSLF